MHGFADTVRFRGRGLTVDRAVSTGHKRIIRGGAVMPFTCCFVPASSQTAEMSSVARCGEGRSVTMHDMCAEKPRRFVPKQDHVMAAWRGQEAVGVVSPTARAHPHRESCLFGDDVVSVTTHFVWLVVAPIVGFCEYLRGRCGVFSVQGSNFFAACV